jgi:hypothetical protein
MNPAAFSCIYSEFCLLDTGQLQPNSLSPRQFGKQADGKYKEDNRAKPFENAINIENNHSVDS